MNAPFDDSKENDVAKPEAEGTAKPTRKGTAKPKASGSKPHVEAGTYTRETHAEEEVKGTVAKRLTDYQWIEKYRPAWAAYVRSRGFEVKSLNRGVITELGERGYTKKVAWAILRKDGTVECFPEDVAPSEAEANDIAAENAKAKENMPRSARVTLIAAKAKARELENEGEGRVAFILKDVDGKHALMIHLRVPKGFDEKDYFSWTYWSDGNWRLMEPNFNDYPEDRPLPLFGLDNLRPIIHSEMRERRLPIMIHEGAKPAAAVREMLADPVRRKSHPLAEELDRYEHMGWIGGVNNWDRVNFAMLMKHAKDREMVFASDNDRPGMRTIPKIAK